jgi:hypothetical protein
MNTFDPAATPADRVQAVTAMGRTLAADDAPILIGPWRSEVGFESLYWTAWLKKLAVSVPRFRERAVVVTRGGMACIYSHLAEHAVDLYSLRSVVDVRRQNLRDHRRTQLQKQLQPTPWDAQVMDDAAQAAGVGLHYHTVHPAWMYWSLSPYWDEVAGLQHLASLTDHAPLPKPSMQGSPLPPQYVAVKFYHRATFPFFDVRHRKTLADFVTRTVSTIAAQIPVVWIQSSPEHDDHADIGIEGPNISTLAIAEPAVNLQAQATVLAHATAFIGVYGGMAQFALRMGVPSASFYLEWGGTAHAHLALSSALSKRTKTEFLVGSVDDVHLWRQLITTPRPVAPALPAATPEALVG